ncbi:Crp/Fnr family transcriptional regulator [Hephaestia mangrovi]|uniref:Crp/Fnr family transcriptional regulator n=1 Tax=Hephaestia mangrovi TaxID=2873268 RepID=UPI001CA6849A|nr:Crp/Fnr family transcriptional regulator [Hephaestia mangrovi]MBY8829865.1 Crp/Fnr family transcriptional regulator [Hephaestia mangrovi]
MSGIVVADDWIGRLPPPLRQEVDSRVTIRSISAGDEFARAGSAARAVFRVRSGFLKQTGLQENGERTLLTIYAAGACFAETAVVAGLPLNHTTIALTDSVVECLASSDFWDLYDTHRDFPDALCLKFAQSIRRQVADREHRASSRLGARIAVLFADLARTTGVAEPDGRHFVTLPITQSDVAQHLGVTRQSVQREMATFKRDGSIVGRSGGWLINLGRLPTTQ